MFPLFNILHKTRSQVEVWGFLPFGDFRPELVLISNQERGDTLEIKI